MLSAPTRTSFRFSKIPARSFSLLCVAFLPRRQPQTKKAKASVRWRSFFSARYSLKVHFCISSSGRKRRHRRRANGSNENYADEQRLRLRGASEDRWVLTMTTTVMKMQLSLSWWKFEAFPFGIRSRLWVLWKCGVMRCRFIQIWATKMYKKN